MNQKILKAGTEINLRIGDVSFSATTIRKSKRDDMIRVAVPVQWASVADAFCLGDECLINYRSEDDAYEEHKMILMEKALEENKSPVLALQHFKKVKSRGELRRHMRFDTFIFAEVGENKNDNGGAAPTPLNGTISNLSISGCSLMSCDSFEIGKSLSLVFDLSEEEEKFSISGYVKNLRQSHLESTYYYGLEFTDLSDHAKEGISSFLEKIKE